MRFFILKKFKFNKNRFLSIISAVAASSALAAADVPPELQNATRIPDFTIPKSGDERQFQLPALPGKPGMVTVLRCRLSSFGAGGCNNCARVAVNDTALGMLTSGGRKRLLFRDLTFSLNEKQFRNRKFRIFKGSNLILPFAKDCDDADKRTTDGLGSWFVFDISDTANPVDVNTVTFRNIRVDLGGNNTLTVKDISIGYLPRTMLPKANTQTLNVCKSSRAIKVNGTKLELFRNGGFAVTFPGVKPFVVETGIGMALGTVPTLRAADKMPVQPTSTQQLGKNSFLIVTRWQKVQLNRTLIIADDGRLDWYDKWTNIDKKQIQGIPLRYRTGLAGTESRNWLCGSAEVLEGSFGANPTIFYENLADGSSGCGFSTEDDISPLVLDSVNNNGIVEIFSRVLALAPGKSQTFHYSVSGVAKGGYWKFINDMRKRWGVGMYGVERPCFWGATIPVIKGLNTEQRIQRTLGSLGKITVAITPWFGTLGRSVMHKKIPKNAVTGKQAEQRAVDRKALAEKVAQYKRLLPNAKIMLLHHPAMQTTYMPEFKQNPLSISAIRNADGTPYHHDGYDSMILKGKQKEGWAVIYYLPLPGTPWYERLLSDIEFAVSSGADGLYFDEFSFMTPRHYRRYDYSSWDGVSADLDEQGKVVNLKSDNALTTILFKTTIAQRLAAAGLDFLCNGGEVGRGASRAPGHSFVEGTALINMPAAHLHNVPLVLGNYGTERTRAGVMVAVREALSLGCIYSPHVWTNTVLEGEDNFVCKLYPVTVTEIGPGFVAAKERFSTSKSGTFTWKGVTDGTAELFIYNAEGNRINKGSRTGIVNGKITLNVPPKGLVIAEKIAAAPTAKKGFSYLAIGNSITLHNKCSYWWNRIGMAATEAEKDYVHLVTRALEKEYGKVNVQSFNFFNWEVLKHDRSQLLPMLDKFLKPDLDLVSIQLGENVSDNTTFRQDLIEMLEYIRSKAPGAKLVIVSDFWSRIRHPHKIAAAEKCGAEFADLAPVIGKKEYMCGLNTIVKDDAGKPHKVTHAGVGRHPGDKGMAYIADTILKAFKKAKK